MKNKIMVLLSVMFVCGLSLNVAAYSPDKDVGTTKVVFCKLENEVIQAQLAVSPTRQFYVVRDAVNVSNYVIVERIEGIGIAPARETVNFMKANPNVTSKIYLRNLCIRQCTDRADA